jgi:hypothetical protein
MGDDRVLPAGANRSGSLSHRLTGARPPSQDVRYALSCHELGSGEIIACAVRSNLLILFFHCLYYAQ